MTQYRINKIAGELSQNTNAKRGDDSKVNNRDNICSQLVGVTQYNAMYHCKQNSYNNKAPSKFNTFEIPLRWKSFFQHP